MGAEDQLAIDDGVGAEVFGNLLGPSSVPTATMTIGRVHTAIIAGTRYNHPMAMCGGPSAPQDDQVGNTSGRKVFCVKFQKELPGLDSPPWPGEVGQRIYENVSAQAWKLWEERQKMILNEYRLMPWQKEGQEMILKHMEDFFFGEGSALPPDFVPQQAK